MAGGARGAAEPATCSGVSLKEGSVAHCTDAPATGSCAPVVGARRHSSIVWRKVPMRRFALVLLAGLLALGFAPFIPSGGQVAAGERACFDGVPYCAENAFLAFWK